MSFTITDAFVQQFTGNVRMLAQQSYARLAPCVTRENITGESAYMEQVAPSAARKRKARHDDSPVMNTQHLRRRITTGDYEWGDLIDRADRVRLLIDPESTYAKTAAASMERGKDDEIIAAFFATAYTGHTGTTSVVWPNGNSESTPAQPGGTVVAVNDWTYGNGSGNTGLSISKLVSAKVALDAAEGEETEERFIAVSAKQVGNLLATAEYTSSDYNYDGNPTTKLSQKANPMGSYGYFMGFNFIHSERLLVNSNSQTRVPAWRMSGMGLGTSRDIDGKISERPDKSFSTYVFTDMTIGSARLEEAKVVEIVCA